MRNDELFFLAVGGTGRLQSRFLNRQVRQDRQERKERGGESSCFFFLGALGVLGGFS